MMDEGEVKGLTEGIRRILSMDDAKTASLFDELTKQKVAFTVAKLTDYFKVSIGEGINLHFALIDLIHYFVRHEHQMDASLKALKDAGMDIDKAKAFAKRCKALDKETEAACEFLMYANSLVDDVPHLEPVSAWYHFAPYYDRNELIGLLPVIELAVTIDEGEKSSKFTLNIPITDAGRIIKIFEDAYERTRREARTLKSKDAKGLIVPEE
jgi:hypothetical protein